MLRMESDGGWWLVTHPDHARLAGAFAEKWGNARFRSPEPRGRVLYGIAAHDDGWAERDAHPIVTREGKPAAFSTELVGKYSAFEEIDLVDYLAVRERAVRTIAAKDAYAGLLIALHTYNLLTAHADRSTIAQDQLPLLDEFLEDQREYQRELFARIQSDDSLTSEQREAETIQDHFKLLQACDNLSLLSCVAFGSPANLLHPLPLSNGGAEEVLVVPVGLRRFRLDPWPFTEAELTFSFPARHVSGRCFATSADLEFSYLQAPVESLEVTLMV